MVDYRKKKILTYFTIGLIFLLSGIEYAVILPTIWRYLQTLGAAPYFLGLGLSAFSLTGLLSGPLFGHWSDRTRTTKKIILFANMFEIVGNFMYFMGYSKWLLLSSRLVAGIGTGAGSSIFGFLTRSTATEDRATVFAAVMACRQAGLLIGPAFNIFLRLCDFRIGPFVVNKYTAPGLFMCLLWILLQLAVVFMYWDLQPQEMRPESRASSTSVTCRADGQAPESGGERGIEERGVLAKEEGEGNGDDDEVDENEDDEVKPLMGSSRGERLGSYGSVVATPDTPQHPQHPQPPQPDPSQEQQQHPGTVVSSNGTLPHISSPTSSPTPLQLPASSSEEEEGEGSPSTLKKFSLGREFLREDVVVLLAAQFITLFNQTALETMVTPMTQKYFDFGELENSVMYCICGVEVIACFLFVRWLSTRVAERMVLAVGLVLCNISCVWCLIFLAKPLGGFQWQLTEFIIGVFLQVIGLPFVAVAQVSLFSKVTAEKTQGFSQGVRRSVGGLATILGPLWAGGLTDNMYIMLGVMMGLLVMLTIMVFFSYERLVEPPVVEHPDDSDDCG